MLTTNEAVAEAKAFMDDYLSFLNNDFVADPGRGLEFFNDASDIRYFDLASRERAGKDFADFWWETGPYYAAAHAEFIDMEIHADASLALVTMIQHYWGSTKDGNSFDFTYRCTDGLQKIDGRWRIVHEHISFPVDIATGKADFASNL